MAFIPQNQEMSYHFQPQTNDSPNQSTIRNQYQAFFWQIDALPQGPEASVAKRKLLESLDAALRCQAY